MPHINRANTQYSFAESRPSVAGWETVSVEEFNALRAGGWNPTEYAPIPRAISNADLRRGLVERGINPQLVTDYISAMEDGPAKWATWADWEYANYMERAHPMLDQLAPAFGLTSADVDALFKSKAEWHLMP